MLGRVKALMISRCGWCRDVDDRVGVLKAVMIKVGVEALLMINFVQRRKGVGQQSVIEAWKQMLPLLHRQSPFAYY